MEDLGTEWWKSRWIEGATSGKLLQSSAECEIAARSLTLRGRWLVEMTPLSKDRSRKILRRRFGLLQEK